MIEITIEQIKQDLETAAYVERMLPPIKPRKYQSWLFQIIYTPQELAFMERKPMKIRPTQEQINIWDKVVLKWLPLLTPFERNLVWKRANHIPWKLLCRDFGRTRIHLWQLYKMSLLKIQCVKRKKRLKCSEQKNT